MSMNARAADPSMEEILASIRRIIADDLPSRREPRPALEVASAPQDDFSLEDYAREEVVTPPPAAPTRRAPEPSLMGAADLPLPDPVRRLIDLAAVEDQVQAEVTMALRGSIPSEPRVAATTAQAAPATAAPAVPPASAFASSVPPAPVDPLRTPMASPSSPVAPAPGLPPRPTFNFGQPPRPPVAPPQPDRLVSAPTNAAVSASFGTLARTIMSNNSRSLEDVVAELLKPMLRSWLDDNLPTIVERLVKAEIERVSRGGR
jgi:cell pole-organizing protein PopZ